MTRRLVHLAGYSAPYATSSFLNMQRELFLRARDRGWDVEAVYEEDGARMPWAPELARTGVPLHFWPTSRREGLQRLRDLLADGRPALLHTHYTTFDAAAAVVGRSRPDTAVVWHLRTALVPGLAGHLRNRLKFTTLGRGVDAIFCNAQDMLETALARGAPRDRISLVRNPLDVDSFPPLSAEERAAARERHGFAPDATVLVHFGRLWHLKGGDLFLEGVRLLRERGLAVEGITVAAPEEGVAMRDRLGLADVVRVIPYQERARDLYAAADVFVSCSRQEGQTFAVSEAFCCGVPVVATDIPGQAAQAPGAGARRLIPFDPAALADAVVSLVSRPPEVAAADAEAARAWVREHLDLGPWCEEMLDRYDTLLPPR